MVEDASIRIMDVLDEVQRTALESLGTPVAFPAEHTIFWEGQPSRSVLIIQHGHVKVTRRGSDDTDLILAVRGEDEIIGEEGVLMSEPRAATVTTIMPVRGLDISAEDLLRFVDEHRLWPVMYRAAVRRRRQSDQRAMLARLDVKSRLARWLLELADEVGEPVDDGWAINAALSQQDFAGRIGASRDAVAIELRRLREQGLVSTGRRRIVLHDLDALTNLAHPDLR
jgi:CRP/FNR family transcriptional regulator, cyclic AMP receptor protein